MLPLGLRRFIRDNITRVAIAVLALDWIVVRWKTFVWLDLAALAAMALAEKIKVPEPLPPNMRTLDGPLPLAHDAACRRSSPDASSSPNPSACPPRGR